MLYLTYRMREVAVMFRVGIKISQDGDYAVYDVPATSSFSAVVKAMALYCSQADYTVYEIIVRRLYD